VSVAICPFLYLHEAQVLALKTCRKSITLHILIINVITRLIRRLKITLSIHELYRGLKRFAQTVVIVVVTATIVSVLNAVILNLGGIVSTVHAVADYVFTLAYGYVASKLVLGKKHIYANTGTNSTSIHTKHLVGEEALFHT
jgi:hypothetical protein